MGERICWSLFSNGAAWVPIGLEVSHRTLSFKCIRETSPSNKLGVRRSSLVRLSLDLDRLEEKRMDDGG